MLKEAGGCEVLFDYPDSNETAYECPRFKYGQTTLWEFGPGASDGSHCDPSTQSSDPLFHSPLLFGPDRDEFCLLGVWYEDMDDLLKQLKAAHPESEFSVWFGDWR